MIFSTHLLYFILFFANEPPTSAIYTLSLHDALPICDDRRDRSCDLLEPEDRQGGSRLHARRDERVADRDERSEEHTSELQSHVNLVCRLLLEKKKLLDASSLLQRAFCRYAA